MARETRGYEKSTLWEIPCTYIFLNALLAGSPFSELINDQNRVGVFIAFIAVVPQKSVFVELFPCIECRIIFVHPAFCLELNLKLIARNQI